MLYKKNSLFLLGGYDLEMLEIKNILDQYGIKYIDLKLLWGAKLSSYKKYFDFEGTLYGIELEKDIQIPKNYKEIDHHGKNIDKKSSIEQVADILNIELNPYQKLIAINDSKYISGLIEYGLSFNQIEKIRAKDRQAQGITQKDEELAEKSISLATDNIIYSFTNRFTCITDKIYNKYEQYIIYNDKEISFYGYKISKLINFLSIKNISNSSYYYGGGDFGYLGIKENMLNKKEILNLIKEFKSE